LTEPNPADNFAPNPIASSFRIGIGATVKGDIGIGSTKAGLVGHVYFKRKLTKKIKKEFVNNMSRSLLYIGSTKDKPHKIKRKKIRRGLRKAMRMGAFFAKNAAAVNKGKWGIYKLKTSFTISGSGEVGATTVNGLATAQIGFKNTKF